MKKISKILLSCFLIILLVSGSLPAYADSGASALPPKETKLKNIITLHTHQKLKPPIKI